MLKRILSVSMSAALAVELLSVEVATTSTLYRQMKTKNEALYVRLGGNRTIEIVVNQFIGVLSSDSRINKFAPTLSNDPKRLSILKKNLINQICAITCGPCKYSDKDIKSLSAEIGIIGNGFNYLLEAFVIALNKVNVPKAEQVELLVSLLNTEQDVPVGELREGIRPTRRYTKEVLIDEDVEEMDFDDELKLQEWLNLKAREKKLLRSLIPVAFGTSIFIFVSDGAGIKSNPYKIHRLNNRLKKGELLNLFKQHRSRLFIGIHQLEGSSLIVFRDGK